MRCGTEAARVAKSVGTSAHVGLSVGAKATGSKLPGQKRMGNTVRGSSDRMSEADALLGPVIGIAPGGLVPQMVAEYVM